MFKHVKHLAGVGAVVCATAALAVACSKDTSDNNDSPSGSNSDGGTNGGTNGATNDLAQGIVGTACTPSGSECKGTGATCASSLGLGAQLGFGTTAPGGYCTADCSADSECGGGVCIGAVANAIKGQCLKGCSSDTDCRDGYTCSSLDTQALAQQAQQAAADAGIALPDGGIDVPTIPKACTPTPESSALGPNVAGKACSADTDCAGKGTVCGKNEPLSNRELPGGYCSGSCVADGDCGTGGACLGAIQTPLFQRAGTCVKACSADSECRTDYVCATLAGVKYCGLPAPNPDAGVGGNVDAGSESDAGHDAGYDAGSPDAS